MKLSTNNINWTHLFSDALQGEVSEGFRITPEQCYMKFAPKSVALAEEAKAKNNLKCKFCAKDFSAKSRLMEHLVRHTNEKPFPCSICDKKFTRSDSLKKHLFISHFITLSVKPDEPEIVFEWYLWFLVWKDWNFWNFNVLVNCCFILLNLSQVKSRGEGGHKNYSNSPATLLCGQFLSDFHKLAKWAKNNYMNSNFLLILVKCLQNVSYMKNMITLSQILLPVKLIKMFQIYGFFKLFSWTSFKLLVDKIHCPPIESSDKIYIKKIFCIYRS